MLQKHIADRQIDTKSVGWGNTLYTPDSKAEELEDKDWWWGSQGGACGWEGTPANIKVNIKKACKHKTIIQKACRHKGKHREGLQTQNNYTKGPQTSKGEFPDLIPTESPLHIHISILGTHHLRTEANKKTRAFDKTHLLSQEVWPLENSLLVKYKTYQQKQLFRKDWKSSSFHIIRKEPGEEW